MRRKKWILVGGVILILVAGITYGGRRIQAQMAERQVQVRQEDLDKTLANQSAMLGDLRDIKSDLHDMERDLDEIKRGISDIKQALR